VTCNSPSEDVPAIQHRIQLTDAKLCRETSPSGRRFSSADGRSNESAPPSSPDSRQLKFGMDRILSEEMSPVIRRHQHRGKLPSLRHSVNSPKILNLYFIVYCKFMPYYAAGAYMKHVFELCVRYKRVLTAENMSVLVFWVVTPCGLVGGYVRFWRTNCHWDVHTHLQITCRHKMDL
jgi:hypothetical protein